MTLKLDFSNRYGQLRLALVSNVSPVDMIFGRDIDDQHKFKIDNAEKIALITDNNGVQLACHQRDGGWLYYVVVHDSPSTAAVARIEHMNYVGGEPRQEIADARRGEAL